MKRLVSIILILMCLVNLTYAEDTGDKEIIVILDGQILSMEEPPYIKNGRLLVPVRFLFEPLGLEVQHNNIEKIAIGIKEGLYIEMPLGSVNATVNGKIVVLDSAAEIINQRTYVPLRFVAESTGASVKWDGATSTVTIQSDALGAMDYEDYLIGIEEDATDYNGPNFIARRSDFHAIVDEMLAYRSEYTSAKGTMNTALMALGNSAGVSLAQGNLKDNMIAFHTALLPIHLEDTKRDHSVTADGYYNLQYDTSYAYTYVENYQITGYRFGYDDLDGGYIISLIPYSKDRRQGIGYKLAFNDDGSLRYEAYFKAVNDKIVQPEYTNYTVGIEAFDEYDVSGDVLMRIEPDGRIYIPAHVNGVSALDNYGVGFLRFPDGVEYVGYFDQWDRLGQGLYFAPEDSNILEENLMDLRADEILDEIVLDTMTDAQKVKSVHDYLTTHIVYDEVEKAGGYTPLSHTAYGALINGVAVCDGYSEAFKYILDKLGIENVLIFGEGEENGNFTGLVNHAWNLVNVNGFYTHYDLTWNDDDLNQRVVYTYYNKSSDYMDDTHDWDINRYIDYLD